MFQRSIVLFLLCGCFSFSSMAVGQYTCKEMYSLSPLNRAPLLNNAPLFGHRQRPEHTGPRSSTEASKNTVFRNPELLTSLIRNRKYELLRYTNRNGDIIRWFLSLSNNGRLYRVVIRQDTTGKTLDMYAETPLEKMEKEYYHQIGRSLQLEGLHTEIKLPRKGKRELIIEPSVIVKLEVKHEISVEDLIHALRRTPPSVKYRPNRVPHLQGKDSFLFSLDVGTRAPLEIVMVYEKNAYTLLTAFFTDVYQY